MGAKTADVERDLFNESKKYVLPLFVQGPGERPLIPDDLNDGFDIIYYMKRRLAQTSLGDGFKEDAFKIISNSSQNDFNIIGGNNTGDSAKIGYLKGIQLSKFSTSNFLSTTNSEIHAYSTNLTSTTLTDSAANYSTNELIGRRLYPNIQSNQYYTITANTQTTITTSGNLLNSASIGDRYRIGVSTPSSTRIDSILLDVYIDQVDSNKDINLAHTLGEGSGTQSLEAAIRKKAEIKIWVKENSDSDPASSFVDTDSNKHYVTRIAKITRTSGISTILNSHITDLRNINFGTRNENFNYVTIQSGLSVSGTSNFSGVSNFSGFFNFLGVSGSTFNLGDCLQFSGTCVELTAPNQTYTATPSGNLNFLGNSIFGSGASNGNIVKIFASGVASGTRQRPFLIHNQTENQDIFWLDPNGDIYASGSSAFLKDVYLTPTTQNQIAFRIKSYNFPTTNQYTYTLYENGEINQSPRRVLDNPYYDLQAKGKETYSSPAWRVQGYIDKGQAIGMFDNLSASNENVPNLTLRNYSSGTTMFPLFDVYTRGESSYRLGGKPTFAVFNDGVSRFQRLSSGEKGGFALKEYDGVERIFAHCSGVLDIRGQVYAGNALRIMHTSGTLGLSLKSNGQVFVNDDGTNNPGMLIRDSGGTNRNRVNVNGYFLSTAQITQNPTNPQELNILSNKGSIFNYDYDNDGNGSLSIKAGTQSIATFGQKSDPLLIIESGIRIKKAAGAVGGNTIIRNTGTSNTIEITSDNSSEGRCFGFSSGTRILQLGPTYNDQVLLYGEKIFYNSGSVKGTATIPSGSSSILVTPTGIAFASGDNILAQPYAGSTGSDLSHLDGITWWVEYDFAGTAFRIKTSANLSVATDFSWFKIS